MLFVIHLLFVVINVIEAKLESYVIALKNPALPNYAELNRREHQWSAVYYGAIVLAVSVVAYKLVGLSWTVIPVMFSLLINRRIFFDYALKLFRKKPIKAIEGDQPLDVTVRKVLGANGGYMELLLLVALLTALLFIFKTL